ncbi:hypothetical protein JTB14_036489 [Gonioctena quinquepunctata]|nr:hypothetical protein JTB14_036489 [Gonioctena quinquepunctata]
MVDDLEKAEAKMLAEKTEIENSEQDSKPYDEIHWEDEYYAYLSNSENDEGQAVYFDKYQEAKNQLKEMRKGKETRSQTPPPTHTAKVTDPPASLYPEAALMQLKGQKGISMEEVTTRISLRKTPACLYPNVVIISQSDVQAQGKDTVTDLSPDEEKVRDIRPKIKILPQLDGPTDPSSDEEWIERGNSPITKGKNKRKTKRRKFAKSPKKQDDISDYEDECFSHLSSIESEEESEQESEKFRETGKILKGIAENKKKTPKTTQAGPTGRSYEMPAKPNEGEKEGGNKNLRNPKKGGKQKQKKNTPSVEQERNTIKDEKKPPPIILEGKPIIEKDEHKQKKQANDVAKYCYENEYTVASGLTKGFQKVLKEHPFLDHFVLDHYDNVLLLTIKTIQ